MVRLTLVMSSALLLSPASMAQTPPPELPSGEELARVMRTLLLPNLPSPLVEESPNWGRQEMVVVGIRWEKKGILFKPESMKKLHNDGLWRRIRVDADRPQETLQLAVQNVRMPEPGKLTFGLQLRLHTQIKFEQQLWQRGHRLFSGETRAVAWVLLQLNCESTSRAEKQPGALLPDLVFRLRVTEAKLNYDHFEVKHTAGIGGDGARLLGEAVHETIRTLLPSLEKKMLEKANTAIVKAADTKEIRLSLSKLMQISSPFSRK